MHAYEDMRRYPHSSICAHSGTVNLWDKALLRARLAHAEQHIFKQTRTAHVADRDRVIKALRITDPLQARCPRSRPSENTEDSDNGIRGRSEHPQPPDCLSWRRSVLLDLSDFSERNENSSRPYSD